MPPAHIFSNYESQILNIVIKIVEMLEEMIDYLYENNTESKLITTLTNTGTRNENNTNYNRQDKALHGFMIH